MKNRILSLLTLVTVLGMVFWSFGFSERVDSQSDSANSRQTKPKKLRERAAEGDVEVNGPSGCDLTNVTLDGLRKESSAIVYGRIKGSRSFFDESSPSEAGDYITTEYNIDILRVLKDTTRMTASPQTDAAAPLTTALKIARNGGTGRTRSLKSPGPFQAD